MSAPPHDLSGSPQIQRATAEYVMVCSPAMLPFSSLPTLSFQVIRLCQHSLIRHSQRYKQGITDHHMCTHFTGDSLT